jgi:murein DD-endopeptidase MepM/ murein hydrolase activator NlpD
MRDLQQTAKQSTRTVLGNFLRRCTGVVIATTVLLLCAPLLRVLHKDPPFRQPEQAALNAVAESLTSQSRIGVQVRSGDTLGTVLKRFGVAPPSARALIEKVRPFVNPRKIRPGDNVHVLLDPEDRTVRGMEFVVDDNLIRVKATENGWLAERHDIPSVRETRVVRGMIKDSLYESGTDAGLSPQQILDLAKIFEYDIDFFSDFQPGDGFSAMVEEVRYSDGRRAPGRILAAELEAARETFSAFYFTSEDGSGGYYSQDGESMRRSFLRAPLSYARISSPFNRNRLHPIFRTVRPHLAIDYAAPAGTPVVAIGRGRVEFRGWRNGYGNVVDIRHSGNYMSRYAHFSRFASSLRRGQAVDPGDVIGYVGQTGHATGPHLHFEFLSGGTKINFLDLRIPKTQQLVGEALARFNRLRAQAQTMLHQTERRVVDRARKGL